MAFAEVEENRHFDNLITLILQHVEEVRHPAVLELVKSYKQRRMEEKLLDAATSMANAEENYKKRVTAVFNRLLQSENLTPPVFLPKEALEQTGALTFTQVEEVKGAIDNLLDHERAVEKHSVIATFYLGRLFHLGKCKHRTTKAIIHRLGLNISRQEVEKKITIYKLLTNFPRLQRCHVPVSFLYSNALLISNEAGQRAEDWRQ